MVVEERDPLIRWILGVLGPEYLSLWYSSVQNPVDGIAKPVSELLRLLEV